MEDDEDADPTAVITLRSGLGASPRESSHSGLIDGPPARFVVVSTNLAGTGKLSSIDPPCGLDEAANAKRASITAA